MLLKFKILVISRVMCLAYFGLARAQGGLHITDGYISRFNGLYTLLATVNTDLYDRHSINTRR